MCFGQTYFDLECCRLILHNLKKLQKHFDITVLRCIWGDEGEGILRKNPLTLSTHNIKIIF